MLSPVEADADAFSGSVKDESGGIVAGATITVSHRAPGRRRHGRHRCHRQLHDRRPRAWRLRRPGRGARALACSESPRRFMRTHRHCSIVLDVDGVRETVTVTSDARRRPGLRHSRPTRLRHLQRTTRSTRAHGGRRSRQRRSRRAPAAHEPEHGRHLRARSDRQQGQRLRRRRALLERRAARRRQHVPQPDRSVGHRRHRSRARPQQRRVRQRCARRHGAVPDEDAVARGKRHEGRRRVLARRDDDVSGRRRQRRALVGHADLRAVRRRRRTQGRRAAARRRHRFARGGDALPRRALGRW